MCRLVSSGVQTCLEPNNPCLHLRPLLHFCFYISIKFLPLSLLMGGNSKSLAISWEVIAFISSWLEGIVLSAVSLERIMVDAGILWTLPKEYFIKINVHSFYLDEPLPNGNRSGIGIVFRDDRGTMVRMIADSLRIQRRRLNELYAMQYALRRAFFENYNLLELETDHGEAYWEWMRSNEEGVRPEH
ncbi:hypothetical protein POM88_010637 [Heracleum sosnowskyi]|uniref:RNase H type-1 domain-containing protein n=1 Tax=Heracleum sosnowskyi TaxID=360622 RepID=A0AAD8ITV9_9APIA|nr:hypothetical protein POM88_010637 [Heracleum sosnowskyi]